MNGQNDVQPPVEQVATCRYTPAKQCRFPKQLDPARAPRPAPVLGDAPRNGQTQRKRISRGRTSKNIFKDIFKSVQLAGRCAFDAGGAAIEDCRTSICPRLYVSIGYVGACRSGLFDPWESSIILQESGRNLNATRPLRRRENTVSFYHILF